MQILIYWIFGKILTIALLFLLVPVFGYQSIYTYNVSGIQKLFILSKYSSKWNAHAIVICQERWQCHELCFVYLSSLSMIPLTFALYILVTGQPEFAATLTADCLFKYLIRPINFPLFSIICITERPSFVCKSSNFLNLIPFPKKNGSYEMNIKFELYRAEGPCV